MQWEINTKIQKSVRNPMNSLKSSEIRQKSRNQVKSGRNLRNQEIQLGITDKYGNQEISYGTTARCGPLGNGCWEGVIVSV